MRYSKICYSYSYYNQCESDYAYWQSNIESCFQFILSILITMMDSKRKWNYWILLLLACVSKTSNRSKDRSGSPSALVKEMHQMTHHQILQVLPEMVVWQAKCIQMLCHTHSHKGNQIRNSRSKIHTATSFQNFKFQPVSLEAAFRPSWRKTSWSKWCVSHHCYYSPGDSRLASPFVSWLLRRDLGGIVSAGDVGAWILWIKKVLLEKFKQTLVGINIYIYMTLMTY